MRRNQGNAGGLCRRFFFAFCCASILQGQSADGKGPRQIVADLDAPFLPVARQWIKDPRPLYRAWATELLGRSNDWSMAPALVAALGDLNRLRGLQPLPTANTIEDDEGKARLAILYALIQGHYPVPKEVSLALFARYPAQALILLYRDGCPDIATSLFVLRNSAADAAWLLAAECLAAPAGTVELLQYLHVKGTVQVLDQEKPNWRGGAMGGVLGGILGGVGSGASDPRSPWPAAVTYTLNVGGYSNATQVRLTSQVAGYGVFYARERGWTLWRQSDSPRRDDRSEYVLGILKQHIGLYNDKPLSLELAPSAKLHWTTAEQYRSDLQAFADEQQRRYGELISALLYRGLLKPAEIDRCKLSLEIRVTDLRFNQLTPIPILGIGDRIPDW